MSHPNYYRLFAHLDAPKRYLSLTVDELVIAIIGFSMLGLTQYKLLSTAIGFGLLFLLRALKHGQGPKALLVLAYWHLPYAATQFFLPKLPASHHRLYVA